jgi:hypothetical protein
MAELVQKWQAEDGSIWPSREEAERRDFANCIYALIRRDARSVKDEDAKQVAACLAINYGEIVDVVMSHAKAVELKEVKG